MSSVFGTSFCTGATSAGFGSGVASDGAAAGGASDSISICALLVSSGRGADVITGVSWDDSGGGEGADDSEEMDAIVAGASSSEGVRKPSFKGSVSSGEEMRRLESVGDDSGFTESEVPWRIEEDDCESLDGDMVPDDARRPTPFSSTAGVRGLDRFRLGRGGGVSEIG